MVSTTITAAHNLFSHLGLNKRFGGYYMTFSMARKIAIKLGIDVGEDTEWNNRHLEWPINNWLCTHGKLHIKAAGLKWPREGGGFGIVFISKWCQVGGEVAGLTEDKKDLEVKQWLEELGAEGLQWVSMLDRFRIGLGGIQPQQSDMQFRKMSMVEFQAFLARPRVGFTSFAR
jgi:hypothetical protein